MEKTEKSPENQTKKRTTLWELFSAFFRIGLLTFGGGIAMLPMLERECVKRHGWVDNETLADYFAIGQCTPGVIAVNTATFIGTNERGFAGAAAATVGVVTPSVIIILVIAMLLTNFADIPAVQHAFAGIRVAVCALMLNAVIKLLRSNVKSWTAVVIAVAAFALTAVFELSPVIPVVAAALFGIVSGLVRRRAK